MSRRGWALLLSALAALFFLRVAGQLCVLLFDPAWLPPFERWYSGLIPYPILFPLQILILAVQSRICVSLLRSRGASPTPRQATLVLLKRFAILYFGVMAARLFVFYFFVEGQAWNRTLIPVAFHWCLAAFVFVYARYHLAAREAEGPTPRPLAIPLPVEVE